MNDDDALVAELCRRVATMRGDIRELLDDEVRRLAPLSSPDERRRLTGGAIARLQGLSELEPLLADPTVDEVFVNGSSIWIDRSGALEPAGELGRHGVELLIERLLTPLGRRVDRTSPIVDARLPDGARVCAVVAPVAVDGPYLSVRKFPRSVRPLSEFTDAVGADLCRRLVHLRCNVLVTGATSSGKTSLLATLVGAVDPGERVVVIEDTTELPTERAQEVRLEARPPSPDGPGAVTLADLVRAALRLRPDRLVVGEVRGDEVLGLVQALNTGHDGSFSTCHANGPLDALHRLESLVLQAAPRWPLESIREQLDRSLDAVVHVVRRDDGRRHIESIHELVGEPGRAGDRLRPLATLEADGRLRSHGAPSIGRVA